ncbi:MAG: hypothetical protein U5K69_19915 [Balneolaceae bacterium]|nr:hypothetical protein [Balneolaceae bacterium]
MRLGVMVMLLASVIPQTVFAQQWQTVLSVDSRVGYSTNTYLNPYFSEWDGSANSGYGTFSVTGQTAWFDDKNMAEFTGALVYEPFLGSRSTWSGGLALLNYRRNLTDDLSGGIESGASYFGSNFSRTLLWAQPVLSWSPSLYTNVRVKAGSSYRQYQNYPTDSTAVDSKTRIDHYALEIETWPSFRWKLSGGLYGRLQSLPAVA